jgi:serine protease Do
LTEARQVGRGQQVAVLGYPLGDLFGGGLKLTTGVISATPEIGNNNHLVLDARVNPGNSGGPLCDAFGNVVGLVTAKSYGGFSVDSYGLALPCQELDAFLKKHLKNYKPATAGAKKLAWDEVDQQVSGSVLMILKAPAKPKPLPPRNRARGGGNPLPAPLEPDDFP